VAGHIFRRGIALGLRGSREAEQGVGFLLHSLGTLELSGRRYREALRVFSTGANIFPGNSHLLLGRALALMRVGDWDIARGDFRASVDADPHHAHAWQAWAVAEKQSGNLELARVLLRKGLMFNPSHGALWQAFAVLEMQTGNVDVARTLFAQSFAADG
jgi:Flp pilus assembly protein TadD